MSVSDIKEVINAFAAAAAAAKDIGFDGIEVHGAHSFLIDEFLWTKTNQRNDAYGGSIGNRTRFAAEIVAAVRTSVGLDFLIAFRYSKWKQGDYKARIANNPLELEKTLVPLVNAGVDIFHPSTHRYESPAFAGSDLSLAGWTKNNHRQSYDRSGKYRYRYRTRSGNFACETSATRPVPVEQVEARLVKSVAL